MTFCVSLMFLQHFYLAESRARAKRQSALGVEPLMLSFFRFGFSLHEQRKREHLVLKKETLEEIRDDRLRLFLNALQMRLVDKAFGVDLVDVLGA